MGWHWGQRASKTNKGAVAWCCADVTEAHLGDSLLLKQAQRWFTSGTTSRTLSLKWTSVELVCPPRLDYGLIKTTQSLYYCLTAWFAGTLDRLFSGREFCSFWNYQKQLLLHHRGQRLWVGMLQCCRQVIIKKLMKIQHLLILIRKHHVAPCI